jgi:Asp-tRNA(Asn)/Glu-tRNA(Gln) amidotransferase A subunit family amidase
MPTNAEICRMEAAEIAGSVRAKKLSPLEVVEAVLERMTRLTRLRGGGVCLGIQPRQGLFSFD